MATVQCPNPKCKALLTISDASLGQKLRCGGCQTVFIAAAPEGPEAVPSADEVEAPSHPWWDEDTGHAEEAVPSADEVEAAPARKTSPPVAPEKKKTHAAPPEGPKKKTHAAPPEGPKKPAPAAPAITVVARPVGGRKAAAQPSRSPAAWLAAAALALLLPLAVSGGFAALKWQRSALPPADDGAGNGTPNALPTPSNESYGAIELGSKGVKWMYFDIFPQQELGWDFDVIDNNSTSTNLVKDLGKTKQFDPAGLKATLRAVRDFYDVLTKQYHLPPEKIFVVGSSGLTNAVATSKDLKGDAKEDLIKSLQEQLADAVEKAVGKRVEFVEVEDEARFQVEGVVRRRDRDAALYLDFGSGGTRGGYRDVAGQMKKFEGPGLKKFQGTVQEALKGRQGESFAAVASDLAGKELRPPFHDQFAADPGLKVRGKAYLVGGIVWVLANYQHPGERGGYVALSARDIDEFAKAMRAHPDPLAKLKPPAGLNEKQRVKMEKDVQSMREKFTAEELIAGAEVLKAVSAEFAFKKKELFFYRHGDYAWVMEYVASNTRLKK